jgi:ATP-dependent exoDNAse (exonuclease V) alpha subunit
MLLPPAAPQWTRPQLWDEAEEAERRKNSVVAREVLIALPHELPDTDRIKIVRELSSWLVSRYGVAVDAAIHAPRKGHDERNHHAHLLMTTRRLTAQGLSEKTRELDDKQTGPREIESIRATWAEMVNAYGFNLEHRARRPECTTQPIAPRPNPSRITTSRTDPRLQPQF